MTATPTTERRRFGMHEALLYDVITKQAGTLQKAVLEGVMNGVDAGATRIDITLDENSVKIVDDGSGFPDRQAIEQFFETFGTPHQEGDATYGRFRMGRGQMMAFGVNHWRTNTFRMHVDIKGKGLDYDLEEGLSVHKGCSIEIDLYKPLLPSERDNIQREIASWVAFVSIPVKLNGRVVSKDPSDADWDVETSEALIKLAPSKSTLSVYNLGVLVMHAPASRYGTGGTVVSKKRLDVNFARNDVQSDCPVFQAIRAELRKHAGKETRKARINDHQRQHLAEQITGRDIPFTDAVELPVITDIEGRYVSLGQMRNKLYEINTIVCAPRGDRRAIKIAQNRLAFVIASETLERFSESNLADWRAAIVDWASDAVHKHGHSRHMAESLANIFKKANLRTPDDFAHLIDNNYEAVPTSKLKAAQRLHLKALQAGASTLSNSLEGRVMYGMPGYDQPRGRTILVGRSDVAEAWTDGMRFIWIEERMLALANKGYGGALRLASLLLHEFMHDAPDTDTHTHDVDFYNRFHDISIDSDLLGETTVSIIRSLASSARDLMRKPSRGVVLFEDQEAFLAQHGAPIVQIPPVDDTPPYSFEQAA